MLDARPRRRSAAVLLMLLAGTGSGAAAYAEGSTPEEALAMRLFERVSGVPLNLDDPRLAPMTSLVKAGKLDEAAQIAIADDHFYDVTLKTWALALSNRAETPFADFNDFAAMVVGVARDDLDARSLLTGNFTYTGAETLGLPKPSPSDNNHYQSIEAKNLKLQTALVRREPQGEAPREAAGVLTSRAWGLAHLKDGTNRRALQFTFQEFLCAPISSWKDASLPDYHVRRDVTRSPGSDPATYEGICRACHAPMDAMDGAYARFDYQNDQLVYLGADTVAYKMNKNSQNYPDGWRVVDDSWINLLPTSQSAPAFGWRGPTSGNGLQAFGSMIAESKAFSRCLAERVFSSLCKRDPEAGDSAALEQASRGFEDSGYKLKQLFSEVARLPSCLGTGVGS